MRNVTDRFPGYDLWKLQAPDLGPDVVCDNCDADLPREAQKRGVRDCLDCAAPAERTIQHLAAALRKIAGPCMTEARRANCDCPRCIARRSLAEVAG